MAGYYSSSIVQKVHRLLKKIRPIAFIAFNACIQLVKLEKLASAEGLDADYKNN